MKLNEVTDPMQSLLTGYIIGGIDRGRQSCKIVKIENITPAGFEVLFYSGLRLAVKVEVVSSSESEFTSSDRLREDERDESRNF